MIKLLTANKSFAAQIEKCDTQRAFTVLISDLMETRVLELEQLTLIPEFLKWEQAPVGLNNKPAYIQIYTSTFQYIKQ